MSPSIPQCRFLRLLPRPADYDRHVLTNIDLDEIWRYMNPVRLYNHHLGTGKDHGKRITTKDPSYLQEQVRRVQDDCRQGLIRVEEIARILSCG